MSTSVNLPAEAPIESVIAVIPAARNVERCIVVEIASSYGSMRKIKGFYRSFCVAVSEKLGREMTLLLYKYNCSYNMVGYSKYMGGNDSWRS